MTKFHSTRVNLIEDEHGSSIRILGPVGLEVDFEGHQYDVDSEMLQPPMSIVIYTDSLKKAEMDYTRVLAFVRAGLEWNGFTVRTITP